MNFGEGLLTPREKEVMQLLIRGYSSKESARMLDISYETERVQRKNEHKLEFTSKNIQKGEKIPKGSNMKKRQKKKKKKK